MESIFTLCEEVAKLSKFFPHEKFRLCYYDMLLYCIILDT